MQIYYLACHSRTVVLAKRSYTKIYNQDTKAFLELKTDYLVDKIKLHALLSTLLIIWAFGFMTHMFMLPFILSIFCSYIYEKKKKLSLYPLTFIFLYTFPFCNILISRPGSLITLY